MRRLAAAWPPEAGLPGREDGNLGFSAGPAEAWAALQCLPHACDTPDQARLTPIAQYDRMTAGVISKGQTVNRAHLGASMFYEDGG